MGGEQRLDLPAKRFLAPTGPGEEPLALGWVELQRLEEQLLDALDRGLGGWQGVHRVAGPGFSVGTE